MKFTYRFVFSILLFLSITTVFCQNFSNQETGFDAARITATLKKRGLTDENIQEEVVLMRKLHIEQYVAMKKSEDEILQKITSEQALPKETNKTSNTGLTAKTANTLVTDIPQTEKDALLALYNSTNGNNWTKKTGWDFSTPVTSVWYGITVTAGHVTGINLSNNNLNGTIPSSIGQLTELQTLYLNTNQISGTIPVSIGLLTKLKILHLFTNQLSGSIPAEIGQLTKITSLYLHQNQLTGRIPAEIGQLTKTTMLLLYANQLNGQIPPEIGQLTELQYLSITNNKLSGIIPAEIGQLTKLQSLLLNNNELSGTIPASIGQLTKLQNLFLHLNQLSGSIPAEIGKLTNLTKLYLFNNQLTGTIPSQIGQLTQLVELWLYNNQLSGTIPVEIEKLTNLKSFNSYTNKLSGTIPIQIGKLTNLQQLSLHGNQLSGAIPAEIGQLTQLQILQLYNNRLSGAIPAEMFLLTKLTALHLQLNQLTGAIPVTIGQLTQLKSLYLNNNYLYGTIPIQIGLLTQLLEIYLANNKLNGTIPPSIGELTQLKTLSLYNNQLEGNIPDLTNLTLILNFHTNKFRFADFASQFGAYKTKLTVFEYYNQAKTDSEITITKAAGETQTLTMYEDNRFTPNDTYQWYKNGVAIAGATSRQYTLSNLTPANAGDYHCVSTNPQMTITTVTNQNLVLTRNTIHLKVNNCNAILSSDAGTNAQTICASAAINPIVYTTSGLITGATFSGLPAGVTGNFASNTITISGTPATTGSFSYTVTYTGNCGSTLTSKGTITISNKTVNTASAAPVVCVNTTITPITHTTQGGILTVGTPSGLPSGVTATWASNLLMISGTPTTAGVFNYSIPLLGGCGNTLNATGKITVSAPGAITLSSPAGTDNQSKNINTIITPITYTTTGTAGATVTGLPDGVTGSFASNTVTITGTPIVSGVFNYLITLAGECNTTIGGKIISLCEPITGIIKIINEPVPTGYPFQFSNSKTTALLACSETSFPIKFYAGTNNLVVGTQMYLDNTLQTKLATGNLWYKLSVDGISHRIDSSGKIAEVYNDCSAVVKSYWYRADDPVISPLNQNYVVYISIDGDERTAYLSREESGNPCEEIIARRIVRINRVSPCAPPSYSFQNFSSGKSNALFACNETNFPNTFYSDSPTMGMDVSLYLNGNLTIPLTDGNLWYKSQSSPKSYKINNFGKVIEVSSCNTVPTDPGYLFGLSQGAGSSEFACSLNNNYSQAYYAATSTLDVGTQLYYDSSLTITAQSDNSWYKLQNSNIPVTYKINNNGVIDEAKLCGN